MILINKDLYCSLFVAVLYADLIALKMAFQLSISRREQAMYRLTALEYLLYHVGLNVKHDTINVRKEKNMVR